MPVDRREAASRPHPRTNWLTGLGVVRVWAIRTHRNRQAEGSRRQTRWSLSGRIRRRRIVAERRTGARQPSRSLNEYGRVDTPRLGVLRVKLLRPFAGRPFQMYRAGLAGQPFPFPNDIGQHVQSLRVGKQTFDNLFLAPSTQSPERFPLSDERPIYVQYRNP